jgi:hypothetical protein
MLLDDASESKLWQDVLKQLFTFNNWAGARHKLLEPFKCLEDAGEPRQSWQPYWPTIAVRLLHAACRVCMLAPTVSQPASWLDEFPLDETKRFAGDYTIMINAQA